MRQKFLFSLLSLSVFLASCQKGKNDSYSTLSEASQTKPTVAIAPVIDHSESGLGWDLSDEFTYCVSTRLIQKNKFRVVDPQKTKTQIKKTKVHTNPFGNDLSWVKTTFPGDDFVVFMELIEHREKTREGETVKKPELAHADLNLSLRLRIIDLRKEHPRIALQEIIQDSHFIPRQLTSYNQDQAPWNSEGFNISPVGIAHASLIKELAGRIEDYVVLSRGL
jgi:hypothetical protein